MNVKGKILVIDDEKGLRDVLFFELEQQGYEVITAKNGEEGIQKAKEENFDIAIVDFKMPGIDGVTMLGEIKKIDPEIEVIMVTGYSTIEIVIESLRKGAYDYISKPFNIDEISIVIEKALEKRQLKGIIGLHEISKVFFSSIKLDELLKIIIDQTIKVLKADDASIMLFDDEGKLYIAISYGLSKDIQQNTRLSIGEGIAGRVAKDKKPLLFIDGLQNYSKFKDIETKNKIHSSIIIPLLGKTDILGILNINRVNIVDLFTQSDLQKANIFGSQIALAIENANLYNKLANIYMSAIRSLANAIDAKDSYTRSHSENVTEFAVMISKEMGLNIHEIEKVKQASQIHDLGKIGIHDYILNKKEKLTDEEWEEMKSHAIKGAQILEPLESLNDIAQIIRQHHERYDGSGYPDGLKGEDICLEARIIGVADAFEAMTSDRPYRKAFTRQQAINELIKNQGAQFDSKVVEALLKALEKVT